MLSHFFLYFAQILKGRWCTLDFKTPTDGHRIVVEKSQKGNRRAIHPWRIYSTVLERFATDATFLTIEKQN